MKDLKNHHRHTQRKVIREARQQEAQNALLEEKEHKSPDQESEKPIVLNQIHEEREMGVEVEEIPLVRYPPPTKRNAWPQKAVPQRSAH